MKSKFSSNAAEKRSMEIDAWIERVSFKNRKIWFGALGTSAILLSLLAIFLTGTLIYKQICLILSFLSLLFAYRCYGKEPNMYKAIIYSFFIMMLFDFAIICIILNLIKTYLAIGFTTGLLYLGSKGLENMWDMIGG